MARSEEFVNGAASVREPLFRSIQQQANENFQQVTEGLEVNSPPAYRSPVNQATPDASGLGVARALPVNAFHPGSVLDTVMPNQNGMGTGDLERRKMGIGSSAVGSSETTFDKRLWLGNADQINRANRAKDE